MSRRFVPVTDAEKPRCEQDEESLRKHRKFDTPFAQLPKDLNEKKKTNNEDMNPMGRPSGEVEKDDKGLWRKKEKERIWAAESQKAEVFDKPQTWGRETIEYTDPEVAGAAQKGPKWGRKGVVGWGTQGTFGGPKIDVGLSVAQRGEVNQAMEKNEKGLWVKRKATETDAQAPVAKKGNWICPKCWAEAVVAFEFCRKDECNGRRPASAIGADAEGERRSSGNGEDPRLEAAKKKGRGTADAAKEAIKALEQRRTKEIDAKEQLGMMRRRQLGGGDGFCEAPRGLDRGGGRAKTMNSREDQVRPSQRQGGVSRWAGVQRTDEDAKKVVAKAVGGNVENSGAPLRVEDSDKSAMRQPKKRNEDDFIAERIAASISRSRSREQKKRSPPRGSRSRSGSKSEEGKFAWEESASEPASPVGKGGDSGEVVVDFF